VPGKSANTRPRCVSLAGLRAPGSRLVGAGSQPEFRRITHFVDNHDDGILTKAGLRFRREKIGYHRGRVDSRDSLVGWTWREKRMGALLWRGRPNQSSRRGEGMNDG